MALCTGNQNGQQKDAKTMVTVGKSAEILHENSTAEQCEIDDLLVKVNHVAIVVSDVVRSVHFFSDVLGLQQLPRPNSIREGAWLSMGNIQLHLIKGIVIAPVTSCTDNLIVQHIALDMSNVELVLKKLLELNIGFHQNVPITNANKSQENTFENSAAQRTTGLTQYFFRDPDGNCIEVRNRDILTQLSFNKETQYVDKPLKIHPWDSVAEQCGIDQLLVKVNHVAIVVSDVVRSVHFYSDVLGLQQIPRPNSIREGAWLSMGNIQLHLIKRIVVAPVTSCNDNLIVQHIALDTSNVELVLKKLRKLDIDFHQNVPITNVNKSQKNLFENSAAERTTGFTQYFFKDPDGNCIEVRNQNG